MVRAARQRATSATGLTMSVRIRTMSMTIRVVSHATLLARAAIPRAATTTQTQKRRRIHAQTERTTRPRAAKGRTRTVSTVSTNLARAATAMARAMNIKATRCAARRRTGARSWPMRRRASARITRAPAIFPYAQATNFRSPARTSPGPGPRGRAPRKLLYRGSTAPVPTNGALSGAVAGGATTLQHRQRRFFSKGALRRALGRPLRRPAGG